MKGYQTTHCSMAEVVLTCNRFAIDAALNTGINPAINIRRRLVSKTHGKFAVNLLKYSDFNLQTTSLILS
jgi:hypothetical protein